MTTLDQDQQPITQHQKSKADWIEIIQQWRMSGMSQVAFCKKHNISFNQFTYQYSKISGRSKVNSKIIPMNIIPDEPTMASSNYFILHYAIGIKLHIPLNAHPDSIKTLLNCLGVH